MRYLLILFLSLFSLIGNADTFLWKVSKENKHIYLGGTFHMLKQSDYPLPKEFEKTYNIVDWLVFETDIGVLESDDFQQQFQQAFLLPSGKTLQGILSPDTFRKLKNYCVLNHIDINQYMMFKPQFLSLLIVIMELQKYGLTAEGVDNHFYKKALEDGKITTQLETTRQQLHYLSTMAQGNEDNLIEQTLDDARELENILNNMRDSWRNGKPEIMNTLLIEPMRQHYPGIYQSLLVERNNNWLPRIKTLLSHGEVKMVLVGALHLAGPDGLLNQLSLQGYEIQQVQ